jgi:uncharacterized protein (TIGR02246 family)
MLSPADQQAISASISSVGHALATQDFDAFAAHLTDDCDWVNVVGMHWQGKPQTVKAHRVFFSTMFKGVKMEEIYGTPSEVAPGVALVTSTIKVGDYTTPSGNRMTGVEDRMTYILVQRDGKWLIRSAHNTTIDPVAAQHDPGK